MKTNQEFKNEALSALRGNWPNAVVCTILFMVIACVIGFSGELLSPETQPTGVMLCFLAVFFVFSIFVLYPLEVGFYNTFRKLIAGDADLTRNLFKEGFSNVVRYGFSMFLMELYVILWSLCLVVPGIIKSFSYAMTPYILRDNPELSANQAIDLSRKMMKGHKFDLFWLMLSFFGWILLTILTLGIGIFWLLPYMYTSMAAFYCEVKAEYEANLLTNN